MPWIDLHNDILWNMSKLGVDPLSVDRRLHCDLPRLLATDVRAAVWAVFVEPEEEGEQQTREALARCADAARLVERAAGRLVAVRRAADLAEVVLPGPIAGRPAVASVPAHGLVLAIEGLHPLRGSLELLDRFHTHGVRLVTLTWNHGNSFATGCRHPRAAERGLSSAGRRLLTRLGELGVILDLAHAGPRALREALDGAPGPVLVSHAGCRALCEHPRNLADDDLERIADRDGLVGITIHPPFLRSDGGAVTVRDVAAHIGHAVRAIGVRHVALGTDFDGITRTPVDLPGVAALPRLLAALAAEGLTPEAVAAIAWGNAFRFLREALSAGGGYREAGGDRRE